MNFKKTTLLFFVWAFFSSVLMSQTLPTITVNDYMMGSGSNTWFTKINNSINALNLAIDSLAAHRTALFQNTSLWIRSTVSDSQRIRASYSPFVSVKQFVRSASDTSTSWTSVIQRAIDSSKGRILYFPDGVYNLSIQGTNPYDGAYDYCIDLKSGNSFLFISSGATIKLKNSSMTTRPVDVIIFKDASNIHMFGGGTITQNATNQAGWSGGYLQITAGCIINGYRTTYQNQGGENILIENLTLTDCFSNPVNIRGSNNVSLRWLKTSGVGEGFQLIECANVLIDNCYANDSTTVSVGDAFELSECLWFEIRNCVVRNYQGGSAFDLFASKHGILNNFIVNNATSGIALGTSGGGIYVDDVTIENGILRNISSASGALEGAKGTIRYNNIVIDSCTTGFQFATLGQGVVGGVHVIDNLRITQCGTGGIISGARKVVIKNTTIDSCTNYGLQIYRTETNSSPDISIFNCLIRDNGSYGIFWQQNGIDATYQPTGSIFSTVFRHANNWKDFSAEPDMSNFKKQYTSLSSGDSSIVNFNMIFKQDGGTQQAGVYARFNKGGKSIELINGGSIIGLGPNSTPFQLNNGTGTATVISSSSDNELWLGSNSTSSSTLWDKTGLLSRSSSLAVDGENNKVNMVANPWNVDSSTVPNQNMVNIKSTQFAKDIDRFGFLNRTETTITFDTTTKILTLVDAGSGWSYYRRGFKHTISGNKSIDLTSLLATGSNFIYIDTTIGTLSHSTTAWSLFSTKVPVAYILWDDNAVPKHLLSDERHTVAIDRRIHAYLHTTLGTQYGDGGALYNYTLQSAADASNRYGVGLAHIFDEDKYHTTDSLARGTGTYGDYFSFYRTGASTWTWSKMNAPFKYTPSGYIQYDANGTLTQGSSGNYYNTYVGVTDYQGTYGDVFVIHGRSQFNTVSQAQKEDVSQFDWSGFPIEEAILLWRITWRTGSGYSSVGKVRIETSPEWIGSSISSLSSTSALSIDSMQFVGSKRKTQTVYGSTQFTDTLYATNVLRFGNMPPSNNGYIMGNGGSGGMFYDVGWGGTHTFSSFYGGTTLLTMSTIATFGIPIKADSTINRISFHDSTGWSARDSVVWHKHEVWEADDGAITKGYSAPLKTATVKFRIKYVCNYGHKKRFTLRADSTSGCIITNVIMNIRTIRNLTNPYLQGGFSATEVGWYANTIPTGTSFATTSVTWVDPRPTGSLSYSPVWLGNGDGNNDLIEAWVEVQVAMLPTQNSTWYVTPSIE